MAKILLAEDDAQLNSIVRSFLLLAHHQVESVTNGEEAILRVRISEFDLLILDWDLPQRSGLEVVTEVRALRKATPILMITGKAKISDKMTGLDSGADDYLTKPFALDELGARVRALLRRSTLLTGTHGSLTVGALALDVSRHRVTKSGTAIDLLPKEFQLLEFLMRNSNQVFAPDALINKVWPSDTEATAEALRTTIKRLRKKIDPEQKTLRTIHGVGYILDDTE